MQNTDITAIAQQLSDALGFDLGQVTGVSIRPHQVEVTSTYVNGSGEVKTHKTYYATTITL